MSTSRANPTAPMAMPTLAPMLRLLELLVVPWMTGLLVAEGKALEKRMGVEDLVIGVNVAVASGGPPPGDEDD